MSDTTAIRDQSLNVEWRALDRCVFHFVREHGGSELLADVAAWCSLADGLGHTALALGASALFPALRALDASDLDDLRAQALVSDGSQVSAFVLRDGRFWLWRNFAAERVVARSLAQRLHAGARSAPIASALLDALFAGADVRQTSEQRRAVQRVGQHRLLLLTGAPGTGKTTTVLRMLLALVAGGGARVPDIRLAAPTGKAAQRLLQALRDGIDELRRSDDPLLQALLAALPVMSASTVHRLLSQRPRAASGDARAARPLDADVVVVDEASMLDLQLLRALLQAMRSDATLILVGDPDQLLSVEAGSTLMDIHAALDAVSSPQLLRLTHVFRADLALQTAFAAVRAGDAAALGRSLRDDAAAVSLQPVLDLQSLQQCVRRWAGALAGRIAEFARAPGNAQSASRALQACSAQQLLCALRDGEFGAQGIARAIERELRVELGVPADAEWFAGRSVIIAENDYARGLFNGDIGIALRDGDGALQVWFAALDGDGVAIMRALAPDLLPQYDSAAAITIHKAQGSEYAHVGIVLPPQADSRVLSRQLLYTALSRAKHSIEIWGSDAALAAAMARPVLRESGLADAIVAALAATPAE